MPAISKWDLIQHLKG